MTWRIHLNKIEYNSNIINSKRTGNIMSKTVTLRVDDNIYQMIKMAADGQRRNLSNFIEFATLQYLTSESYVDDKEMKQILSDSELLSNLRSGLKDIKKGDYTIV